MIHEDTSGDSIPAASGYRAFSDGTKCAKFAFIVPEPTSTSGYCSFESSVSCAERTSSAAQDSEFLRYTVAEHHKPE